MNENGTVQQNTSSLWSSPGYTGYGSAANVSANAHVLVNPSLNLTGKSFTISAWIWLPTAFNPNVAYHYFPLFVHCQSNANYKCLHAVISNGCLLLGFYFDDLTGTIQLAIKRWYHVAYVYHRSTSTQLVYVNGKLDNSRTTTAGYQGSVTQVRIGSVPSMTWASIYNGLIDRMIFVPRVKNASELLDEATLVAYYPFDGSFTDLGPNHMNNTFQQATVFESNGYFQQSLRIYSPGNPCFRTTGFYYLGQSNTSFSFALWVNLYSDDGTLLQVDLLSPVIIL